MKEIVHLKSCNKNDFTTCLYLYLWVCKSLNIIARYNLLMTNGKQSENSLLSRCHSLLSGNMLTTRDGLWTLKSHVNWNHGKEEKWIQNK